MSESTTSEELVDPVETPPDGAPQRSSKVRALISGLLGVLAVVGLFATTLTAWTNRVLFDSDKVAEAVGAALDEPEVTAAMATYLTDQVFMIVDVDSLVDDVLPTALSRLRPAIVGGAYTFINTRVESLLSRDEVQTVITELVRRSHAALMRLLEGDGLRDGISVTDGVVSVNLLPLISRSLLVAQGLGLFDDVDIPTLTLDQDPAAQQADLEAAFGRTLPDDFGQLVVYDSEKLAQAQETVAVAQRVMVFAKRAIVVIPIVTVVALVASVLVANRRRRAVVILALVGIAMMLLARTLIQKVVGQIPELVVKPGARAALDATVGSLATGLYRVLAVLAVLAAIAAIVAFVTGNSSAATSLRRRVGSGNQSLAASMSAHREGYALGAFGGAVLVVVLLGISFFSMLIAGLLVIAGGWALWGPNRSTTSSV